VFTARYGPIPYINQITFHLLKVIVMDCIVLGASVGGCSGGKNEHRVNNVQLLECLL
jgi:hypothetical protein